MPEKDQSIRRAVALLEDDPERFAKFIREQDIEVVIAATMDKALELIDNLSRLHIPIALIDGNLSPGEYDNSEGKKLVAKIKQIAPEVITINFSSGGSINADVDWSDKGGEGFALLLEILEKYFQTNTIEGINLRL